MKTALLDGDIIAFKAAAYCEARCEGDEDVCKAETADAALNIANSWIEKAGCERGWVCLSDGPSFRHAIYPPYKANRSDMIKPSTLGLARQVLRDNFETLEWPGLEADDLMGIYATNQYADGTVIVTIDKDMLQIPVEVYNPDKEVMTCNSVYDADTMLYQQWLCGDRVDNIKGVHRIGPKTAATIVSGWAGEDMYKYIISHFRSAGISDSTALAELNCIYILRDGDYDWVRRRPRLFYQTEQGEIKHDFDWPQELLNPSGSNPTADLRSA